MLNFSFVRHPLVSEERAAATEKHLRKRASQLLDLSRIRVKTSMPGKIEVNKERVEENKNRQITAAKDKDNMGL